MDTDFGEDGRQKWNPGTQMARIMGINTDIGSTNKHKLDTTERPDGYRDL
jgi:hypothetical protein